MAPAIVLLVAAALCALGSALPLQDYLQCSVPQNESVKGKQPTISDLILSANADLSRPLFQGDIARPLGRSALRCGSCRWQKVDGAVKVPFLIDTKYTEIGLREKSVSAEKKIAACCVLLRFSNETRQCKSMAKYEKRLIKTALEEFSTVSCVRFIERTSETSYISIENTPGCWSYIGRNGYAQPVSLQSTKCLGYGVIQHEVMHALSFNHEHTRPDRDNYVDIMWQYISQVNQGDFKKDNGDTLNTAYNYNSIMHYSSTTFTNTSGKATIIPKPNPKVVIGQRYGLSGLDVVMINRLYACNLCRTKILGTSGTLSSSDASPSLANDNCLWILHVPLNKLFLQFDSFGASSINCTAEIIVYDGVTKTSPVLATISPKQQHHVLISSGLFLLVEYITDPNCSSSFHASYNAASPKYPNTYPNSVQDTSIILAPVGFMVSLNFTLFDLESSPTCSNDFLVIRDGGDTNSSIIGTYCGKIMDLVLSSTGNMMLLQFSSNCRQTPTAKDYEQQLVPETLGLMKNITYGANTLLDPDPSLQVTLLVLLAIEHMEETGRQYYLSPSFTGRDREAVLSVSPSFTGRDREAVLSVSPSFTGRDREAVLSVSPSFTGRDREAVHTAHLVPSQHRQLPSDDPKDKSLRGSDRETLVAIQLAHDDQSTFQETVHVGMLGPDTHNVVVYHLGCQVRAFLHEQFPGTWIGRHGPVEWPPRSPDPTPLDFYLWGHLKAIVYAVKIRDAQHLKQRILEACASISSAVLLSV
ncbi:unnamed protein product [Ranitomeya imitator]|uniref:Metalloendopeptidase n=1 Tax=Ranitomeya imitator TaxID=111125 RepID=A0ABN9L784_9NEOB|nr:unnamed protein product [Ranitomeya imitator]